MRPAIDQSLTFVGHIAKPSWGLEVMTTYFMPASFASFAQACASNFTGLKCGGNFSYSAMGMRAVFMSHSLAPPWSFPWYSPAGTE